MTTASAVAVQKISEFDVLTARALLEGMPSASVILDAANILIAHNTRAEDLLQTHVLAVVGKVIEGPFRMMADRV